MSQLEEWKRDPVAFVQAICPFEVQPWQAELIRRVAAPDMKETQLEEIRRRSGGRMTAMEVMISSGAYKPEVVETAAMWCIPHLIGPWGRVRL